MDDRCCEGLRMLAPMMVARRTPGPAYANLQGRKPREVWRGLASDAMGISTLAVCCRGALNACLERDRRSDKPGQPIATCGIGVRAAVIERHDGYRGWREGEQGCCRSRAGEADGQSYNAAIVSKTSGDQIIGASASSHIDPGCGGTYQITVGIEGLQKTRLVEAGIWLNPF